MVQLWVSKIKVVTHTAQWGHSFTPICVSSWGIFSCNNNHRLFSIFFPNSVSNAQGFLCLNYICFSISCNLLTTPFTISVATASWLTACFHHQILNSNRTRVYHGAWHYCTVGLVLIINLFHSTFYSKSIAFNALFEFEMTVSRWVHTLSSLTPLWAGGQPSQSL